jgi:acyl carrier protein
VLWLKNWLGNKLNINPEEIESDQPILSVGLDSIGAVELENDINNTFDADVFVGDFFENNSIECIAEGVLFSSKTSALEQKK